MEASRFKFLTLLRFFPIGGELHFNLRKPGYIMDCNRDEALRAKEMAERKFNSRDIKAARKFALKAQNLFPDLEGITQMVATLDVYLAAEAKINGENDWYSILFLNALADEDAVKKQYKKLALQLHPDKNKSIGAEGAFKLISEAWSVLSDNNKKTIYDQKRRMNGFHNASNGYNTSNNKTAHSRAQNASASRPSKHDTFWTSCSRCRMQYEYLRVYLNHNLLCPNCHNAFWAVEIEVPRNGARSSFSWTSGSSSNSYKTSYSSQSSNAVHHTFEKTRKHEAVRAAKKQEELWSKNKRRRRNHDSCTAASNGAEERERADKPSAPDLERANGVRATKRQNFFMDQIDIRRVLIEKAKAAVTKKLEEWNVAIAPAQLVEKERSKPKENQKANNNNNHGNKEQVETNVSESNNNQVPVAPVPINVPDPDFHDFDKYRIEKAFRSDQIWAAYDNEDGMPRLYAMVQKVISLKPFKLSMSFLNSKSNNEFGPVNWVASGFTKTCGEFRVGRYKIIDTVNIFSHRVSFEKGPRGIIKILPKKGDIWALYRNWSSDWNELTPDVVIHKYEMVEVLSDYNEEEGVTITPMVKVAGFKTVFCSHMDPKEVRRIPKEEMFRFSHQVPSHLLTGEEGYNAPKGCHELDPAATPVEFLKVITEVKEDTVMENS
nr:unnamed protein product [Ananas comosus var. bracteatus]